MIDANVIYREKKRIHTLHITVVIILAIGFIGSSLLAQSFDFNNGTVQGWTGPHMSSSDPDWNGLSFVFDDYINYPSTSYDPVDGNGSISIQTLQTLSDSPTDIEVEFRSPDLSNNPTWQNAYGWRGQLMFLGDIDPGDPFPGAYLELSTGHEVLIGEPLEVYQGFGWHEITVYFPEDMPGFKWFSLRFNYPEGLKDMGGEEGIYGGIFLDNVEPILELEPSAPEVSDIPNQSIAEGESFTTINLDLYVSDEDNSDEEMKWSYNGNTDLTVTIDEDRVATIGIPNENWNGSETITFTATDPDELSDSDAATFEVTAQNDAPEVSNIPNQSIAEGESFTTINLDSYVSDVDNSDGQMSWSYSGNTDLTVTIDESRVATIGIPNENWNGSETIMFTAEDPGELSDSDDATFEVTAENDAPVVGDIPDQSIAEGGSFATIALDDYVDDVDNTDAQMNWSYSGNTDLTVTIDENRVATIGMPDPNWNGSETITFTASDPGELSDSDEATFTVDAINDPPRFISDLPEVIFNEDSSSSYAMSDLNDYYEDPDGPDTIIVVLPGDYVVVEIDSPLIIFRAPADWFGADTLMVISSDGELSDTAFVYVTVIPVNDAPGFVALPDTVEFVWSDEEVVVLNDHVNDNDLPNDSLRWLFEASDAVLEYEFNPETSVLTFPAQNFTGMVTLYCTVSDDSGASAQDSIIVNVTADPVGIIDFANGIPTKYELHQNYPNPFNPTTHIRFGLIKAGDVKIDVYNLLGQHVGTILEAFKPAGYHVIDFDASHLPSGLYFYRIQTSGFDDVKKMIVIK